MRLAVGFILLAADRGSFAFLCAFFASFAVKQVPNHKERKVGAKFRKRKPTKHKVMCRNRLTV
jgi:hypothetical protein